MDAMRRGDAVEVTDALGRRFSKRALMPVEPPGHYPAIWLCSEEEWVAAVRDGRDPEPEPFPWPLASIGAPVHL